MEDFAALRQRMVDNQIRPSEVTDRDIIRAFSTVPRELFVEPVDRPFAYADRELAASAANPARRMMQPVQLARLIQALPRGPDAKALIVGCGRGYSAAVISPLMGSVLAVDEDESLISFARGALQRLGCPNVTFVSAKLTAGYPAAAPYDAILVEGAVEFVPEALISQLAADGALAAIERNERTSRAMLYERVGDQLTKWPQFDAWATALPGFERRREFVF